MEENKINNKGLIVLVILLIICVLGLSGYIVYDKMSEKNLLKKDINNTEEIITTSNSVTTNNTITDEKIISNFYKAIDDVKQGKENRALLCNVESPAKVDCTNIKDFKIIDIEKFKDLDKGSAYKFRISWTCKDNNECFYNEQYDKDGEKYFVTTYYKFVDGIVTESLGNAYFLGE